MAEIILEVIIDDPDQAEADIIKDFTRFLGARKAFLRLIKSAVVIRIQDRPRKKTQTKGSDDGGTPETRGV